MARVCTFVFDEGPEFIGVADGATWNGFDNVSVTPAVLADIVAYFRAIAPGCEDAQAENVEMLALPVGADGLVPLGYRYATQIVGYQSAAQSAAFWVRLAVAVKGE